MISLSLLRTVTFSFATAIASIAFAQGDAPSDGASPDSLKPPETSDAPSRERPAPPSYGGTWPSAPDLTSGPLAGYNGENRTFFLRDSDSWFVLFFKGRLQVDWFNFLNRPSATGIGANNPKDPGLSIKDGVFLRRARLGLAGTLIRHFDFRVEADFASVATAGQYGVLTDASILVNYTPYLQLEVGQFYAPLTLENQTSENYTDFMEKSIVVRGFAVPAGRDLGAQVFGWLPKKVAYYSIGLFNGDGQNFKNQDNSGAVIGRAYLAPLAALPRHAPWVENLWVGGSFWWQHATNLGGFVTPSTTASTQNDLAGISTQGGLAFFNSSYGNGTDANMNPLRSHLAPDGDIVKYAFELNLPFPRFGVRGEYVHQSIDLRQYTDSNPQGATITRTLGAAANLTGIAYYVELFGWLHGDASIVDGPGLYSVPHWRGYRAPKRPSWALMLAAKYEHIDFDITGLPPVGSGAKVKPDPAEGHHTIDVFEAGANFWASKHVRLTANYVLNYIGAGDTTASGAINETKNVFFQSAEHELLFRFQVAL